MLLFCCFPSTRTHETSTFKARPNSLRESGLFPFLELFFSTNHCAARGLACLWKPRIFTKTAAIRAFTLRFQRNSGFKLLLARPFEPRGLFSVSLIVCLFNWAQGVHISFNSPCFRSIWHRIQETWKKHLLCVHGFSNPKGFTLVFWQKVVCFGVKTNPTKCFGKPNPTFANLTRVKPNPTKCFGKPNSGQT